MSKNAPIIVFLVLAATACATHSSAVRYDAAQRPVVAAADVAVVDPATEKRPYKVIGIVKARGSHRHSDTVMMHLREEAGKIGGQAVLDPTWGDRTHDADDVSISAKVIVFTDAQ